MLGKSKIYRGRPSTIVAANMSECSLPLLSQDSGWKCRIKEIS